MGAILNGKGPWLGALVNENTSLGGQQSEMPKPRVSLTLVSQHSGTFSLAHGFNFPNLEVIGMQSGCHGELAAVPAFLSLRGH